MKKTFVLLLVAAFFLPVVQAQKTLTGTVDYSYKIVGEGAEAMAGMMPKKMQIKYGENSLSMTLEGGMMASMMGKTVVNGDTEEAFIVKDTEESIYLMSKEDVQAEAEKMSDPEIQKFDETKVILGYTCQKYIQNLTVQGMTMAQTIWVTPDLKLPDYKSKAFGSMAGQGTINLNIEGFPMLIETNIPGMPASVELQVTNIKFEKFNKSIFEKPAHYTVKPFSDMNTF